MTAHRDVAGRRREPGRHAMKQRALADAVRTEQAEPLAGADLQGHATQNLAPAVARMHVADVQHHRSHVLAPARKCHAASAAAIGIDQPCSRASTIATAANDTAILMSGGRAR
jgi:hypothetical protein